MRPDPLVIGHRGASGYRPEHTAAAYELAIALGADAVEPDIVASRDGVLVLRHENEIGGTTDVASRPEFAERRTMKTIDGAEVTGWFTEDFDWAELATLRALERLPKLRPHGATFDGRFAMLRLRDLFDLLDAAGPATERPVRMVAELKHAGYFAGIGLPLDELFAEETRRAGWGGDGRLVVECFERSALDAVAARGVLADRVYLIEASGSAPDQLARHGDAAPSYADELAGDGLDRLAAGADGEPVQGISVDKSLILAPGGAALVGCAHDAGLRVFTWTARPENRFLTPRYRRGDEDAAWGDWRGEFRELVATGVDGLFADHPDLARDALG